jgi:dephospho-CoA kinase
MQDCTKTRLASFVSKTNQLDIPLLQELTTHHQYDDNWYIDTSTSYRMTNEFLNFFKHRG